MEGLMNRLFRQKALMGDEKLNEKIERVFENRLFQRIVEKTDVLEDAGVSASQSFVQGQNLLESAVVVENPSFLHRPDPRHTETAKGSNYGEKPGVFGLKLNKKALEGLREKWVRPGGAREGDSVESRVFENSKMTENQGSAVRNFQKSQKPGLQGRPEGQMRLELSGFKKKHRLDESNVTFTDRKGLNSERSRNGILEDLTSKMQRDMEEQPSDIFDNQTVDSQNDSVQDTLVEALELSANDLGFSVVRVDQSQVQEMATELNKEKGLSKMTVNRKARDPRAYAKAPSGEKEDPDSTSRINLPPSVKFPPSSDPYFPKKLDNTVYDALDLRVIVDRERTGFEESKEFPIVVNSVIGARYRVLEYLGGATFSKAVHVQDITDGRHLCLKIIENNKDYLDQSLDEIKVLRYLHANCAGDPSRHHILRFHDAFYFKEHLFLVTELLKDNLYEYYKFNAEHESERFFTPPKLKAVARQTLSALRFLHSIRLLHCDVKPENIMVKSYSQCEFRLIDFGSACFIHDHLSSYIQSRFYRAPEVILGCHYDYKIDVWSLGCVLAELAAYRPLFQSETLAGILARIVGTIGPIPEWMLKKGKTVNKFFTSDFVLFDSGKDDAEASQVTEADREGKVALLVPKKTSLEKFVGLDDHLFIDLLTGMLRIDPNDRLSAAECLEHPWLRGLAV